MRRVIGRGVAVVTLAAIGVLGFGAPQANAETYSQRHNSQTGMTEVVRGSDGAVVATYASFYNVTSGVTSTEREL